MMPTAFLLRRAVWLRTALSSLRPGKLSGGSLIAAFLTLGAAAVIALWVLAHVWYDARALREFDDHIGDATQLLKALAGALTIDAGHAAANDATLRSLAAQLPDSVSNVSLWTTDGSNIGSSETSPALRPLSMLCVTMYVTAGPGTTARAIEARQKSAIAEPEGTTGPPGRGAGTGAGTRAGARTWTTAG